MKDQPFIVRQRANIHSSTPFNQNEDAVEKTKKVGKFVAKQGVKRALKSFGQKALSTAFGVGGMLLSSQKAYGGGEFKSGTYISPEEQKEQFGLIPEETSGQFLARTKK